MKHFLVGLACALVVGCATGYQPNGWSGGFSEIPLASDAYQISVNGNGYTRADRVNEMALLRGAELTRDNGFNYFVVLNLSEYTRESSTTTPGSSTTNTSGSATAYGNSNSVTAYGSSTSHTTYNAPKTTVVVKPGVDVVIRFVPDDFAAESSALSVSQVFGLYAEKYGLEVSQ